MLDKQIVPSLLPVPRFEDLPEGALLPHARKVFALRNIHLRDVKAVGFDMDYTLSHYRSPEIDELAFKKAIRLLVRERGYPAWLLDQAFDPGFAIRGLVLDGVHGNLLKITSERLVARACHGSRPMAREEIEAIYGRRRFSASAHGYRNIDTRFEIPESHLYARLVDAVDQHLLTGKDYLHVFRDVRWAIDLAHRGGEMKAEILAHRDFFILPDPELPAALDRWIRAGKKLFVLSNSEWSFTNGVLSFLLDGQDPTRPHWQDYFELIVVSARKPVFFEEMPEPVPLPGQPKAYTGGHAAWLEKTLGCFGEEVMYVGDHIYGDILRSKKNVSWHTLLLIPELGATLQRLEDHAEDLQKLLQAETLRRQEDTRISFLNNKLNRNREHRHVLAPRLSPEALQALDREAAHLKVDVEAALARQQFQAEQTGILGHKLESAFNLRWGSIFRDGYQQTRFADQLQQYACAYTGKISNLYFVDPGAAIYAPVPTLPHERV